MSTTGITLQLAAVDKTAAVLDGAKSRFVAFGQSISAVGAKVSIVQGVGSSFMRMAEKIATVHRAALGVVAVFNRLSAPIRRVMSEMHELTDRADETGSAAADLLALSNSFQELGVKSASIENISAMLGKMRKSTGRLGVEGFKETMAEIGRVGDATARTTELVRVFGREGSRLEFLLRKGPDAFLERLSALERALPQFSETSIRTLSDIDKTFVWIQRDIDAGWKQICADMVESLVGGFKHPVEVELKAFWNDFKTNAKQAATIVAGAFLAALDALRMALWATVDGISVAGNAIYDVGKNVVNLATLDWSNVNFKHTRAAADSFMDGHDWHGFIDGMKAVLDDLENERGENYANIVLAHADKIASGPIDALEETLDDWAKGHPEEWQLGKAVEKLSNVMEPARWMDAAGYAAQTLGLSSRNANGGAVSVVDGVRKAIEGIRPVFETIRDETQRNGERFGSLLSYMKGSAV